MYKIAKISLKFIIGLSFFISINFLQSCVDDPFLNDGLNYEEGKETTIDLKVKIPEMAVATRGEMAKGKDSELKSLWIGIFSASGKCTYAGFITPQANTADHGGFYNLSDIKTVSGRSYIVAVGNPNHNVYYDENEKLWNDLGAYLPQSSESAQNLGFTWDKFQNLITKQQAYGDIDTPVDNLIMSGVYTEFDNHPSNHTPDTWEEANYTLVPIPVSTPGSKITMNGAIHLRRLISQVKFKISVGSNPNKNRIQVVKVTPQSYKVHNAPYTSYLYEHKSPGQNANSGDNILVSDVTRTTDGDQHKANYPESAMFSGNQYISSIGDGSFEFDFWMLENKRKSIVNLEDGDEGYKKREKERKTSLSTADGGVGNTGIYTALCGESGPETMNNSASFVEIRCKLEYTEDGLTNLNQGKDDNDPSKIISRTADVVYVVHLGGINNDWNDFNHRRNHKYTYNVSVVDLDKIIVEATQDNEPTPGAEGVVTDVTNPVFELDAHYGVFNIHLTDLERTGVEGAYKDGFPFRIEAYDGKNNRIVIDQTNYKDVDKKYWQWVEFRPTTSEDVLSSYKPYTGSNSDGKTFRLDEIASRNNGNGRSESGWYTVFVNEYVYEEKLDENDNNWVDYVNKSNRTCWLQTQSAVSKDKESIHIISKYCFSQKSIQTFYDMPSDRSQDLSAIGLEHENEVFGFNLKWNKVNISDVSTENGRYNQKVYLGQNTNWNTYIDDTKVQKISGINKSNAQINLVQGLSEGPYYVTTVRTIGGSYDVASGTPLVPAQQANINNSNYLVIMNACLNRNRDLNGNGKIDDDEIRWYVPSSSEIVDIVVGRNSLEHPLMDYANNAGLYSPTVTNINQKHHANTRFHYATSNERVLWAEEGVTINPESDYLSNSPNNNWNPWNLPPWQIRCVRGLGTNLAVVNKNALSPAFDVDFNSVNPRVIPTYYENKNMRSYTSGAIEPHQETSTLNRLCYTGFEFQKKTIPFGNWWSDGARSVTDGNGFYIYNEQSVYDSNYHDKILNEGIRRCQEAFGPEWRMPNMKEAALIKQALTKGGIYRTDQKDGSKTNNNQYDMYCFLTCTYREYGNGNNELRTDKTGYYTSIYYEGGDKDDDGHFTGRIHCVSSDQDQRYRIRCVRDIR